VSSMSRPDADGTKPSFAPGGPHLVAATQEDFQYPYDLRSPQIAPYDGGASWTVGSSELALGAGGSPDE
jgi:hypothetical protein